MNDLIIDVGPDDDHKRIESAANNTLNTLLLGMAGIGDLIWANGQDGEARANTESIADVGYLLKMLAEQANAVFLIYDNARFALNQKEKARGCDAG
jgi:hypothetical protein